MSSMDTRSINYTKLRDSEIRILELQPACDTNSRVVCRLTNIALTEDLEFLGLSCLYGDDGGGTADHMVINGGKVTIPATLSQALKHLRRVFLQPETSGGQVPPPSPPPRRKDHWLVHALRNVFSILPDHNQRQYRNNTLRVWIDGLCIDQQSATENRHRRSHMAQVYRSAKMVVGWLGLKDESSDLAVDTLEELTEVMPRNWGDPEDKALHPENYAPHQ